MHGEIDRGGAQRGVDLGGEEFLAFDLTERDVDDPIATRIDADEFDRQPWMRALEHARHGAALRPRQQRTTRAEP